MRKRRPDKHSFLILHKLAVKRFVRVFFFFVLFCFVLLSFFVVFFLFCFVSFCFLLSWGRNKSDFSYFYCHFLLHFFFYLPLAVDCLTEDFTFVAKVFSSFYLTSVRMLIKD